MDYKTLIDSNGNILDYCVQEDYITKEGQQLVERFRKFNSIVKPKWNGYEWIEGATEEEIKASKEEDKTPEKEPNEQEILNAQLLEEIAQQKIVNAQLMQEIASLKGGSTNV